MSRGLLALAFLAGFSASCRQPATQLVVLVDTDFAVPSELSDLRVQVSVEDGSDPSFQDFALNGRGASMPPRFAIPLSFGIVPIGDDPDRRILVSVTGLAPGGAERVTRSARTGFLPNQSLLLPMFLLRSCEGVMCPAGQTCIDATCESDEVDPLVLRPILPGGERDSGLRLDAATDRMDSGLDGGPDSGMDAGMDAGPDASVDAGFDAGFDSGTLDAGASGPRFVRHAGAATACATGVTDVTLTAAVPAGDTLVVSFVWRNVNMGMVGASDSGGNRYDLAQRGPVNVPTGSVLTSRLTTPLAMGEIISVTHPATEVVSVVVDQLAGVSPVPLVTMVTSGRGRSISFSISAPASGLVYAALGNNNNRVFTGGVGWTRAVDHAAVCPAAFATVDHRSYHMSAGAGTHTLSGSYAMPQSWVGTILVFGAP